MQSDDALLILVVKRDREVEIHPGPAMCWDDVGEVFDYAGTVLEAVAQTRKIAQA